MKRTLNEYLGWRGPTTHRQHRVFVAWLNEQLNVPSRSDWYMMQMTATQYKDMPDLAKLKIKFTTERQTEYAGRKPGQDRIWGPKRVTKEDIEVFNRQMIEAQVIINRKMIERENRIRQRGY